jgi:hypothetical protein
MYLEWHFWFAAGTQSRQISQHADSTFEHKPPPALLHDFALDGFFLLFFSKSCALQVLCFSGKPSSFGMSKKAQDAESFSKSVFKFDEYYEFEAPQYAVLGDERYWMLYCSDLGLSLLQNNCSGGAHF